jgi:purine-binding chemotaxis protein CheW
MERQRRKDPSKNLVECIVGGVRYGVVIGAVREIVNPLDIVALPSAPAWILGVADYRDEVVPIVDLRVRFGARADITPRTKWVVVRERAMSFALVVDAVTEVFRSGEMRPAPSVAHGADVRSLDGVTTHDREMVFVLAIPRLAELVDPAALEAPAIRENDSEHRTIPPRRFE